MTPDSSPNVDALDVPVDIEIQQCLDLKRPRSFFLFAGAGSGKTRSLVAALDHVRSNLGPVLRPHGRRIAVVTYTKAARDEIIRRTQYDPLIAVSTIHSFAWTLVEGFNQDIREWLRRELRIDINELTAKEAKGRKGTQASKDRVAEIASKERRLAVLDTIRRFIYSPDSDNRTQDSLNHSEVLRIAGDFLRTKPTLKKIVKDGFPIILVDESQDTNRHIVDALFDLERAHSGELIVGLFGDMMQRIYGDGQPTLGQNLPPEWATPKKQLNFRCPRRVIQLLNKVRSATDGQVQIPKSTAKEGHVRMFVFPSEGTDKLLAESSVAAHMAQVTQDDSWTSDEGVKVLILEHHMAARRMRFERMFSALYPVSQFRTGLLDGSLALVSFFSNMILPLYEARSDKFAVARIVRDVSPLTSADALRTAQDAGAQLGKAREAVESLVRLLESENSATFRDVAENVTQSGLFVPPERIRSALQRNLAESSSSSDESDDDQDERSDVDSAVDAFLKAPFSEIVAYAQYVQHKARFDTHQGVKGLEFPRVMVIMDDSESRGFQFKYEKLFGSAAEEDAILAATRRLFYVICSRAEDSLALVAYTKDPGRVRDFVIAQGWFEPSEVQTDTTAGKCS